MNYYDSIAEGYDELYMEEQISKWEKITNFVKFKGLVLDLGCGTGFITELIPNVIGCDSSIKMLGKCSERLRVVQCDVECLPFKDAVFDTVFSLTVLQDVKNPEKVVEEIKRVLKKKGRIIISVLNKNKINEVKKILLKKFKILKEESVGKDLVFFT